MTTIESLAVTEEERVLWSQRCRHLYRVYHTKRYTKDVVGSIFNEWLGIATRLKKGGEMIDQNQLKQGGDISNSPHMIPMIHLYYFLIIIFNIYDGFFRSMFSGDDQHLYERAYVKVRDVLLQD